MRKFALTMTLLALLSLPLWATYPVTVLDERGKEITLSRQPERVVAVLPLYAEIALDLGAGERIVGIADSPDNPPELAHLPKVGTAFNPSVELILALQPDLVLGVFDPVRLTLEDAKLLVFLGGKSGGFVDRITEILKLIRNVGLLLWGDAERADPLIGRLAEEIIAIEEKVLDRPKVTVAVLYRGSLEATPFAPGPGSPEHEIVTRAGGLDVFSDITPFGGEVSVEALLQRNPEVIITDPSQIQFITQDNRLKSLQAVSNGKVLSVKASQWTSSRISQTLQMVAQFLHPEAFAGRP